MWPDDPDDMQADEPSRGVPSGAGDAAGAGGGAARAAAASLDDLDALLGAFGFGSGPAARPGSDMASPPFAAVAARLCRALAAESPDVVSGRTGAGTAAGTAAGTGDEPAGHPSVVRSAASLSRVEGVSVWLLLHFVWAVVMGDRSGDADALDPASARAGEQWLGVILGRLDAFDRVDLDGSAPLALWARLRDLGPVRGAGGPYVPSPVELGVLHAFFVAARERLRADWRGEGPPFMFGPELAAAERVGSALVDRLRPWLQPV